MNGHARISRTLLAGAVALAAWAALPAVQWCPIDWEQLPRERLLRCAAVEVGPVASCPAAEPAATEACGSSCPFASADERVRPPSCPPEHAAARPEHTRSARAFCVSGPNGGAALRAARATFDPAPQPFTAPAPIAEPGRPSPVRHAAPVARAARPPTGMPHRLPPPRAPPGERRVDLAKLERIPRSSALTTFSTGEIT